MHLYGLFFAHAFGQRYELPLPLWIFVVGGAVIVLASFLVVLRRPVISTKQKSLPDEASTQSGRKIWAAASYLVLGLLLAAGWLGSQETAENILPTLFWLLAWIAVPLSCGLLGDYTKRLNPFAHIAEATGSEKFRALVLGRKKALPWPSKFGWWPAVVLFFILACGELIYNSTATLPRVIATGLAVYFGLSALMGLVYGKAWLRYGEVFSVLYSTWGKLGYFRFGSPGKNGFAGGLQGPFEASVSRLAFVVLLLVSVSFDGLLATPAWSRLQLQLPAWLRPGSTSFKLTITAAFILLAILIWGLFRWFSWLVARAGRVKDSRLAVLANLMPSLLPISFGYLLAHNLEYLIVNGQLLIPLIGNPVGKKGWPIHLPNPFNDSFEIHPHLLPSSFYWYLAAIVIVAVHIVAVVLAHQHLAGLVKNRSNARRSEFPWVVAMIAYTMLSLWLLAQPLVKEKPAAGIEGYLKPSSSLLLAAAEGR